MGEVIWIQCFHWPSITTCGRYLCVRVMPERYFIFTCCSAKASISANTQKGKWSSCFCLRFCLFLRQGHLIIVPSPLVKTRLKILLLHKITSNGVIRNTLAWIIFVLTLVLNLFCFLFLGGKRFWRWIPCRVGPYRWEESIQFKACNWVQLNFQKTDWNLLITFLY